MLFHMCPYDASLWMYYYIRERPNIMVDWSPMAYGQPMTKNNEMAVYWECIDSKMRTRKKKKKEISMTMIKRACIMTDMAACILQEDIQARRMSRRDESDLTPSLKATSS